MSETTLDMRGRACPEPVIEARRAMLAPGRALVVVHVDGASPAENLAMLAQGMGWTSRVEPDPAGGLRVRLAPPAQPGGAGSPGTAPPTAVSSIPSEGCGCAVAPPPPRVVVFVASEGFGQGDETLGRLLMRAFLKTQRQLEPRPELLIFANGGVRWTTEGSEVLDDLRALVAEGAEVWSCGTCLDYLRVTDKLAVGRVSNMLDIATALASADRVVRP